MLGIEHIKDFVGHHLYNDEAKKMASFSGLLYSDFLVMEQNLFISHGRFITVVNLNSHLDETQYHLLSLDNQNISKVKDDYFDKS